MKSARCSLNRMACLALPSSLASRRQGRSRRSSFVPSRSGRQHRLTAPVSAAQRGSWHPVVAGITAAVDQNDDALMRNAASTMVVNGSSSHSHAGEVANSCALSRRTISR